MLKACGWRSRRRAISTRRARLEDMNGSVDMLCFPEAFKRLADKFKLEVPVLVKGACAWKRGQSEADDQRHHSARGGQAETAA